MALNTDIILNEVGKFIKIEAKRMCPKDKGELNASIDYNITGTTVHLFATAPQAEAMEYGTPPSPGGLGSQERIDLTEWAKRHGANPKGVIKYIEKHGIKVSDDPFNPLHITSFGRDSYRPFLRPAVYMNLHKIGEIIASEIKKQEATI
jgi:hypothetical protein